MVTITTKHNFDERVLCIEASGHAGYAEAGKDIVCASVSILLYTLAQSVMELHRKGAFKGEPTIELTEGDACIKCECDGYGEFRVTYQNFELIEDGFNILADNYPQYVSLHTDFT
jgi:uncharacterized protein YsxB (DUF464 family)